MTHGKAAGQKILTVLGKKKPFYDAIKTEVGQMLLQDIVFNLEVLLEKIIEGQESSEDKAMYQALRKIFESWCEKIVSYEKHIKKLKEG